MKRYLVLLLVMTGCTAVYEPKLKTPASDQNKYTIDLDSCKQEAHDRILNAGYSPKGMFMSVFGPAGAAAVAASSDNDDDVNKTAFTMIDECMVKRGYDVAK